MTTQACGIKRPREAGLAESLSDEQSPAKKLKIEPHEKICSGMVSSVCGSLNTKSIEVVDLNSLRPIAIAHTIQAVDSITHKFSTDGLITMENQSDMQVASLLCFALTECLVGGEENWKKGVKWCEMGTLLTSASPLLRIQCYCLLATIHIKLNALSSAIEVLKKAIEVIPLDDPASQSLLFGQLGAVLTMRMQEGDREAAIPCLQKAVELFPEGSLVNMSIKALLQHLS